MAFDRRYFDNTILKDYKQCPRLYYLRHIKGWRREGTSPALAFGLAWHSAMDVVWQQFGKVNDDLLLESAAAAFDTCWTDQGMPRDLDLAELERLSPRTPLVAREMLRGYLEARRHILEHMTLVACEQPFAVPLPADKLPSPAWYAGRLDKVFDFNGMRLVDEHKTTTEYKIDGGFKTQYLESWYLDSQIMGYLYGGALFFEGLEQVWVDAALVHKKVHNAFKFIPVAHQWAMLEQWIEDTCEWVRRIFDDEDKFVTNFGLGEGIFPKQTESCFHKFGACQMLDICRTCADPSKLEEPPLGYVKEPWEPFNILKLDKLLEGDQSGIR